MQNIKNKMNSKISKKRKESRSEDTSTGPIYDACVDPTYDIKMTYSDGHIDDTEIAGSHKRKQKHGFLVRQQANKKHPNTKKGIKRTNSESLAKENSRVKLKKIESQDISFTKQKPMSAELCLQGDNSAMITDSVQQSTPGLLYAKTSASKSGAMKQKSKKTDVKSVKASEMKESSIPALAVTHKSSKKVKTGGNTAKSLDSLAKTNADELSQKKQLNGPSSDIIHKCSKKLKTGGNTAKSVDSHTKTNSDKLSQMKQLNGPSSDIIHKSSKKLKTSGAAAESTDSVTKTNSHKISQMKKLNSPTSDTKCTHKSSKKLKASGAISESVSSQASSDKLSQIKLSNNPVSGITQKSSKRLKTRGNIPESTDSHKKKTATFKKKERDGFSKHSKPKASTTAVAPSVDTNDPMALLMMMEGHGGHPAAPLLLDLPSTSSSHAITSGSEDDEQELDDQEMPTSDGESEQMSDWEEVYDHHIADRSQLPDGTVEITLELPEIFRRKKREKKEFDWKAHLERRVRQFKKEVAEDMHKVHLLCLLALGLCQNVALNDLTLKAVLLSLLPSEYQANKKLSAQRQVENLLLWYKRKFSLDGVNYCSNTRLVTASLLIDAVSQGSVTDARVWILIFISMLRTIGLTVRLVLSFQPIRFKPNKGWDEKKGGKVKKQRSSTDSQLREDPSLKPSKTKINKSSSKPNKSQPAPKTAPAPKRRQSRRESSKQATLKNRSALQGYDADDDGDADYVDQDDKMADDVNNSDSDFSETGFKKMKEMKNKKSAIVHDGSESSFESECEEDTFNPGSILKDLKILSNRKILSPSTSDDEAARGKRHGPLGHDIWLEVYFPDSKKWSCFDCFKSQFGKPYTLEASATQPLLYVLGFKNDNSVKDVTARYAKQWLSYTRKNRIDQEWWTQTLFIFDNTPFKDNLIEDDEIKGQLLVRPMPTSIAEFKSHPLYSLRRHLLKFEAIYPDTAIPLGYIKKEPVYARECVRTLHSRDNWLKEGRLVRLNEQPYKMVKSRPKWNKPKEDPDALDLQLFGEWQTEEYIPPPAVNGKVPRNEYGNVELFKPWMLPKGTVQVRGQSMQRVAKKLNIDIAPAMVGWDHHSGFSHPVMDGWVVCEEFADALMAAWLEDQEIQRQRETEKREKRVYDNWRLLIRGLLIKERLKVKFLQEPPINQQMKEKEETFSDAEEASDVHLAWPRNRQDQIMGEISKADQLKTERQKQLVENHVGQGSDVEITKQQEGGEVKASVEKKKVPVKLKCVLVSEKKRKILEWVHSDSSSSESSSSEEQVMKKRFRLKQESEQKTSSSAKHKIVKKVRSSVENDDPDFLLCDRQITDLVSPKERSHGKNVVADQSGVKIVDNFDDSGSKRRSSLARCVKNKVKFVDETSDSEVSESDEVGVEKVVAANVEDGNESDVADGEDHMGMSVGTPKSRKRVMSEENTNQVKIRREDKNGVLGMVKSKKQMVSNDHVTEKVGDVTSRRGTRSRVRCSK